MFNFNSAFFFGAFGLSVGDAANGDRFACASGFINLSTMGRDWQLTFHVTHQDTQQFFWSF